MASGIISLGTNGKLTGQLVWNSTSNGAIENNSTVTINIQAKKTSSGEATTGTWTGTAQIGENIEKYSKYASVGTSWVTLKTYTKTIEHQDSGYQDVYLFGSITGPSGTTLSGKTVGQGKSVVLDQIPRASELWGISNFTLGNSIPILITKRSSSFTDTLIISLNGTTIKTINNITDGYEVNFTTSELNTIYSKLPNTTKGTFTFTLTTKSGSTTIGTSTKTATGTIPDSVKPTISSVTVSEANTNVVPSNWGVFVRNNSMLKFNISASAGTGSSISYIWTTFNGIQYSGLTVTTGLLTTYGNLTATIQVIDARGRETKITKPITIVNYDNPYITTISAIRCNSNGTPNDSGSYAKVTLSAGVSYVEGKNTPISYQIKYKKSTDSEYQTHTFSNIGTSINESIILSNIDTNNSYDIEGVVADYFTSTSRFAPTLPSAFVTMDYLNGGKGVAMGKVAEEENLFDVNFKTRFSGGIDALLLEAGTNLDDVKIAGFYRGYDTSEVTYTNCPITSGAFNLEVIEDAKGYQKQILTKHRTNSSNVLVSTAIFERLFYNNSSIRWNATGEIHAYNSSGSSGWYKILSTSSTNGYGEINGTFLIKSGSNFPETVGTIAFTYYNNGNPRFRLVNGNIPLSNLKAVKNADNTLDIFIKAQYTYMPLYVTILSLVFTIGITVDIEPSYIGESISSDGEECFFYTVNDTGRTETLYNNSSGSTGTITLYEDVSNFKYIEIYHELGYEKIWNANDKSIMMSKSQYSDTLYHSYEILTISGTSITRKYNGWHYSNANHSNTYKIYRVIGYEG